jgi:TolB protein
VNPAAVLPIVLFVSEGGGGPEVARRASDGTVTMLTTRPDDDWAGPLSPDGRTLLVVSAGQGGFRLGAMPVDGGPLRALGGAVARVQAAAWGPDGRWLVAALQVGAETAIHRVSALTGASRELVTRPGGAFDPDVSPAGDVLVFVAAGEQGPDLWRVSASGGAPELLLPAPGEQLEPTWSPAGTRIAFFSADSGPVEVRTVAADGSGDRIAWRPGPSDGEAVPTGGLAWSPDGTRLAFTRRHADATTSVAVVDVKRGVLTLDSARDAGLHAQTAAWLDDASLVVAADLDGDLELVRLGLDGTRQRLTTRPGADWLPRVVR